MRYGAGRLSLAGRTVESGRIRKRGTPRRNVPAMRTAVKSFEFFFKSLFLFAWQRRWRSGTVLLRLRG